MSQDRKNIKQEPVRRDWQKEKGEGLQVPVSLTFPGIPNAEVPFMFPTRCVAKKFLAVVEGSEPVQFTGRLSGSGLSKGCTLTPGQNDISLEFAGNRGEMLYMTFQGNPEKIKRISLGFVTEV